MVISIHLVAFILTPSITGITPTRALYDEYKLHCISNFRLFFRYLKILTYKSNAQTLCFQIIQPFFFLFLSIFLFNVSRLRIPLARLLERSAWFQRFKQWTIGMREKRPSQSLLIKHELKMVSNANATYIINNASFSVCYVFLVIDTYTEAHYLNSHSTAKSKLPKGGWLRNFNWVDSFCINTMEKVVISLRQI